MLARFLIILLLSLPVLAQDADGDGLSDGVEREGVRVGGEFLDLPAMGADPFHKDLFVEADYMVGGGHSHEPKAQALAKVVEAFARAPVSNPDGKTGVTLHVDAGPETPMRPDGQTWGLLSRANALPEVDTLVTSDFGFGPTYAIQAKNFEPVRKDVFRYCIFGHTLLPGNGTSGLADGLPGRVFLVTLGLWTNGVGTVLEQAGTFMHEMGHTLSLRHGGVDHVNEKPNYLSVMSYSFQTGGLLIDEKRGTLDYSRSALGALTEKDLEEPAGVPRIDQRYGTVLYRGEGEERSGIDVPRASRNVDWNGDGRIETGVVADVNGDGELTVLAGHDDWPSVVYKVGEPVAPKAASEALQELTPEEDARDPDPFEVGCDFGDDRDVAPGETVTLDFLVANLGTEADSYTLVSSVPGLPTEVGLAAGEVKHFPIQVVAPASGAVEVTAVVTSRNNPLVLDTAEAVLKVVNPQVASGSGGTFSGDGGSSFCFIATAAYGSPWDPHVMSLRRFRDHQLLTNGPGRAFVRLYYSVSPPLARAVEGSWVLRGLTLVALTPVVLTVEHPWVALTLLAGLGAWRRRRGSRR